MLIPSFHEVTHTSSNTAKVRYCCKRWFIGKGVTMGLPVDAIAAAADANFVVHAAWAPLRVARMRAWVRPFLTLVDSGLACDTFNIACCARLPANEANQHIRIAMDFLAPGSGLFSWWVGPADQPPWLSDLLVDAGLRRVESELAMAISLEELPGLPQLPRRLAIRRATTADLLETFSLAVTPDTEALRFYQLSAQALLAPDCPQWFFLGYIDGDPVATIEVTIGGGVAGLYNVTTHENWRGQGIASAMVWHALFAARKSGAAAAVLQAADAGIGVYRRLGFETFGEIVEYKPVP